MRNNAQKKVLFVTNKELTHKHMEAIREKFGDVKIERISPEKYVELERNNPKKLHSLSQKYRGIYKDLPIFDERSHHITLDTSPMYHRPMENDTSFVQEKSIKEEHFQQVEDSGKREVQEYIKESMMDYVHHTLHRSDMDFDYLNEAAKAGVLSHAGMAANALQETALEASDIQNQMMLYIREGQHLSDFDYEKILENTDSPEVLGIAFTSVLKEFDEWKDIPFAFEKVQDIYDKLELSRSQYERELFSQVRENPIAGNLLERVQEDVQKERSFV